MESKGSKEPYNDDLQNGMNSIIEFLKESKKYANKTSPYYKYSRFIYRGISKFYPHKSNEGVEHPIVEDVENDTIRSGLSVRLDMTIQRENLNAEKSKPYIRANYVNALRDMIRTAKKQFPNKYTTNMSDLDILADIQHNGGATCLVDFSKNILTALWFACSNDLGADGFVYCYDVMNDIIVNDNLSYVKDENMSIESLLAQTYQETNICSDVDTRFCIWEPTPHNNRIIRQDSVFIFGMEKFIVKDHEINVIKIEANKKRNILLAMEALFNISENTIFDDYIGFANANRKTLSYHKLEFNAYTRGFDDMIDGNYEAALEFLKLHEGECSSGNERDLIELHFSLAVIYKYLVRAKNTIRYEENAISEYDEVIRLIKNVFKKGSFLYLDELKRKKDKDYLIRKCTRAYNGIFDMLYNTKQYQRAILKCNNLIEDIEKGILHNEGQSLPMKKNFSPIYCRITQMELLDLQIITSMSRLENINKEDLNSFNAQIESYYNEAQSILRGDVFFDEILVEYYYFICKVLLATDESRLNTCYLRKFLEFKERYNNENPYNGYILWNFAEIKDAIENIDYRIPHQKKEMLLAATAQIIAFRDEFEVHSLRCSQDY